MERNMGDQLKKAFEAYRQASIEKDSAKRELQQKTEYYESYTQQLERKIEDQNQLIFKLQTQLNLATKHSLEEGKSCKPALRKQEVETLSPSDQRPDGMPCVSQGRIQGNDCTEAAPMSPHGLPGSGNTENNDVLEAFRELQGKLCLIRTLAKKQKDHLRKICSGNNPANAVVSEEDLSACRSDQQFSMPIQCTDVTAARAEGPFSSASLASRGASPDDGDFMDSLAKLSVKFPPSADSEYEFLNSAPEKPAEAILRGEGPPASPGGPAAAADERIVRFSYPLLPPGSPSGPHNPDGIRGPQKPVWSPELCDATGLEASVDLQPNTSPKNCAFCNALVPHDRIYSHLNSHFLDETSNGH